MNLLSFETPPLRRLAIIHAATTTTTTASVTSKDASSRGPVFDGHLDLSLGMSMSGSSGGGDAKATEGGHSRGTDEAGCMCSGVATVVTPANALSGGHVHVAGQLKAGAGWTSAFMPSPTGFMHPWSLAARQQKAAAELDRTSTTAYVPSEAPLPSAVGWPPVHTSRRNLITAMHPTKPHGAGTVNGLKGFVAEPAGNKKKTSTGTAAEARPPPANMFAKVHREGYSVARKINLRAHGSYESLSRVLTKMTRNFFCPADCSSVNVGEEQLCTSNNFIFLYEDFEGDRMLVGDVPWELFIASAKRLYIVRNPVPGDKGHGDYDQNAPTGKATNN